MWLVSSSDTGSFEHKFDLRLTGLRFRSKGAGAQDSWLTVNAFGGKGRARNYNTETQIGEAKLGGTIVGALKDIEGFGGEIGDGCVTSCS